MSDSSRTLWRASTTTLAVLTGINLLNYLDRYVVAALVPALKHSSMGLNDKDLGLLMSAFLVVYMLAAPLFGRFGDRGSRTKPIAVGVFLWSLATGLSGLAHRYWQLLGARAVVGIGEAAYATIAPSLLADSFAPRARGRAFAVFNMAIPVGAALGYIVGGIMLAHYGWRAAFFVAGIPGVMLALWVWRLPEPPRGARDVDAPPLAAPGIAPGSWAMYPQLLRRRPYLLTVLGYAAYTFALGGMAFWMPTFLERVRGVSGVQATAGFGEIVVATGFIGTFAGGWLGDYALKFSRQAHLWLSGWVTLLAVPATYVALASGTPWIYYGGLTAAELFLFMSTGPITSTIVNLVSPTERACAVALSVFMIHTFGDVISPPIIGSISDSTSLGTAVMIVPVAVAVSGVFWLFAARADYRERGAQA